jgi:hypothetical protein
VKTNYRFPLLFAIALLMISGCASQGAKRLPADRFDYNAAIGTSAREQMLLNIVRSRYQEMPVFLEVGSVVAQYAYDRSVSLGYFREFINNSIAPTSDTASADVNVAFSELPTITYQPLQGEAFATRLYSEVPSDILFAAVQRGWALDILMRVGLHRFGAVKNMSFGEVRIRRTASSDLKKLERFTRAIKLLFILSDGAVVEVQQVQGDKKADTEPAQYLVIADEVPEDLRPMLAEFRQLIGITDANRFRMTDRITDMKEDEIVIQTRSVMAMIKFMARGIEICFPSECVQVETARQMCLPQYVTETTGSILITVILTASGPWSTL